MDHPLPESYCPPHLYNLSSNDLQYVAKHYAWLAENLFKRSKRLKSIELMQKDVNDRINTLEASYKIVLSYLEKGYNSSESAACAAARELGVADEVVLGWWKVFIKKRDIKSRDERAEFILRLIKVGYRNYDIASRLGVHENTVSRAIRDHLKGSMLPYERLRYVGKRKGRTGAIRPASRAAIKEGKSRPEVNQLLSPDQSATTRGS